MDEFPFAKSEWTKVKEATHAVMNATLANDHDLTQSLFGRLEDVLEELRTRYGDHPILIETAADFLEEPARQVELYYSALQLAEHNQLPTLSIRLSLARILLEELSDPKQATAHLVACQQELAGNADEGEFAEWSELMSRSARQ